jgi:hypothetical protein
MLATLAFTKCQINFEIESCKFWIGKLSYDGQQKKVEAQKVDEKVQSR